MSVLEIECDLRDIDEFLDYPGDKKKKGRYHGSVFCDVSGFGSKRWVVATKIDLNLKSTDYENLSAEEIATACLVFLNKPPPRKKYAKRQPKPKYGKLDLYSAKIISKNNEKYISALLIVDKKKSPYFWSEGKVIQ